jgi:hypothetical protein
MNGWLAGEPCPDCGGPLLDISTSSQLLVLDCPGCGYHASWHITTTDDPAGPGETEDL